MTSTFRSSITCMAFYLVAQQLIVFCFLIGLIIFIVIIIAACVLGAACFFTKKASRVSKVYAVCPVQFSDLIYDIFNLTLYKHQNASIQ